MLKIKMLETLPSFKLLPGKPVMCQVSMRLHIIDEREYHSNAYALRVNGTSTEFLVVTPDHIPKWIDISKVQVIEESPVPK